MDDDKIIELYWSRSEQAIVETKNKYENLCTKLSYNILHNNEEVEECVNDTYLGTWNAIPTARPVYFSAFLCKIARNLSMRKLEYRLAKKRNCEITRIWDELEDVLANNINLSEEIEMNELVATINEYLLNLSLDKRNIFIRRYFFFDSIEDISKRYGFSKSKIKSILSRDGKNLRDFLAERGYQNAH